MICSKEYGFIFLAEIVSYCQKNALQILVMTVNDQFRELYKAAGFGVVKLGEECCFNLSEYSLAGGRSAKVRAAINHATKAAVTVHDYKPQNERSSELERQFNAISEEWLKAKGGVELCFTVGGTGRSEPMDRRYFYAAGPHGKVLGFCVFLPYIGGYLV